MFVYRYIRLKIEFSIRSKVRLSIDKMNISQLELETRVKIYALEALNAPNVRLVVVAVTPDALL